jgi:Coenzyme PQQ synthesis protein D (PqqD)
VAFGAESLRPAAYFLTRRSRLEHDRLTEKYIARSSAIAARLLGGEMMVMSAMDSTFFTLNEVATAIWQAADGRTPLSEIVARKVCAEFEIDPETAQRDAEHFVEELSRHGILLVSDHPLEPSTPSSSNSG